MTRNELVTILRTPGVDKLLALFAAAPASVAVIAAAGDGRLDLPRGVTALHNVVLIATLLVRTAPQRVTLNPLLWLLALAGPCWGVIIAGYGERGAPLAPLWLADGLSIASLAWQVYARLSLGRNIGLIPAQRTIVTKGAYRLVRHPIYTSALLAYAAFLLACCSSLNLLLVVIGSALFVAKSLIEERFLSRDPQYAAYLARVRWRWLPGLA